MQTARTTIELDKDLLKKAKQKALEEDKTLKQLINEMVSRGLVKSMKEKKMKKTKKRIKIRTYDMGAIKGTLSREEIYDWL